MVVHALHRPMHQRLVDGLLAERSDLLGVALVDGQGLCLASGGVKAGEARRAGAAADTQVFSETLTLIEGEEGMVLLHRWSAEIMAVLVTDSAPHLGAVIAASRHRLNLLAR